MFQHTHTHTQSKCRAKYRHLLGAVSISMGTVFTLIKIPIFFTYSMEEKCFQEDTQPEWNKLCNTEERWSGTRVIHPTLILSPLKNAVCLAFKLQLGVSKRI